MNELELVKTFREGIDEPATPDIEAAWAALARQLEPAAAGTRRIERTADRGRGSRRIRSRRAAAPVAVAAVAIAIAVAVPWILPGRSPGGAEPAAAAILRHTALLAADQPPDPAPTVGQFVYTKTESIETALYIPGHGLANFSFTEPTSREAWIGPDGSGRTVETTGRITFPSAGDRLAWIAAGSPDLKAGDTSGDELYGPGGLYFLDLRRLPTDPDRLLNVLEERKIVGGPSGDWETFRIVGDLLRETWASPQLRAALYEVAANLPGVEYVGPVSDGASRRGLAVASTHDGIRDVLIFDPGTARLLGERSDLVDPGKAGVDVGSEAPGTIVAYAGEAGIVYSAVYLSSGVVDSTSDRP